MAVIIGGCTRNCYVNLGFVDVDVLNGSIWTELTNSDATVIMGHF